MKLYCSCCDKVQPVFVGECKDAKTNETYQDIVCAECALVIASGAGIQQPMPTVSQEFEADPLEIRDRDGSTVFRITSNGDLYQRGKLIEGDDALRAATTEFVRRFTQLCNPLYAAPVPVTTPDVCGEVCARAKLCYGCNKDLEEANAKYVEQAEQESVAQYEMLTDDEIQMLWVNWDANRTSEWYECIEDLVHVVEDYIIQKQTEIDPLGYLDESDLRGLAQGNAVWIYPEDQGRMVAVYTTPVRTKDLTDDELASACGWKLGDPMYEWVVDIGRWAIAADREKNK